MSENEGKLDTVQSYDSEILSAGAMQKTVKSEGYGEFPIQIWKFKIKNETKYKQLLENCGWKLVEESETNSAGKITKLNYRLYYNDTTGKVLKDKIREGFNKGNYDKLVDSIPLLPIIQLLNDVDFQILQIEDYIERLHSAISKKPRKYAYHIYEYIHSSLGKAVVLDHDVYRPYHVSQYFSEALNRLYQNDNTIPLNPNEWGDKHSQYETKLLDIYGPLRGEIFPNIINPMTDAIKRYNNLKSKL